MTIRITEPESIKEIIKRKNQEKSEFAPLTLDELTEILGLTIKKDTTNKIITFLCELSAYTESSQFNISYNAPSSTGKSYIPTEIAYLFPEEDVIEIGYCSPTAFFHEVGEFVKEKNGYVVDLSRKILIFLDQPHIQLLERLRSLLSHDKKEIQSKITDKNQKFGLRTKNVFLKGFPAVVFCTAGLKIDEQEATRFLLLSPQTNQEKIREAIYEKIKKETDVISYKKWLDEDPKRNLLKERILAIKLANIKEIKMESPELVSDIFFSKSKNLKPRHQRDITRIISMAKSLALLNFEHRKKDGNTIIANNDDIKMAFHIWDTISESQELNLPPFILDLYKEIILLAWNEKININEMSELNLEAGLSRQEIQKKHFQVYGRYLADWLLRQQIIPMLETAGLISQEADPNDKRKMLIYPNTPLTVIQKQINSESE